jgi:1-deoxy-D-xylulose-5-phosphate synthase
MSISPNIGGLHDYLSKIRTSKKYFRLKHGTERVLLGIPLIGKGLATCFKKIKDLFKLVSLKTNFFEDLGIIYLGPVDGHDMQKFSIVLNEAKAKHQCCIVHMNTIKGKGYEKAETEPDKYHGVAPFEIDNGVSSGKGSATFTSVVGDMLCEKAEKDDALCAITAAMRDGTGLSDFSAKYPDRFFDVGIAEEHAVTYAAGLAAGGMKPVLALYSTFAQRSYDQFVHDIAIQKLPFTLLLDRAGLVPGDGVTHQGIFDYPLLSSVPSVKIYSPETYAELKNIFETVYKSDDFSVIRYPKGSEEIYTKAKKMVKNGNAFEYSEGIEKADTVIVTYGRITKIANEALIKLGEKENTGILKLIRLFPLDMDEIMKLIGNAKVVYFLEEGYRYGGVSEKIAAELRGDKKVIIHAIETFVEHGKLDELFHFCGFTADNVAQRISKAKK